MRQLASRQLRRAADCGERVLDFVRQNGRGPQQRFAAHGARGLVMTDLRQGHDPPTCKAPQRRGSEVDADLHLAHRDRQIARHQRFVAGDQPRFDPGIKRPNPVGQQRPDQTAGAGAKQIFSGMIDLGDAALAIDQDHREDEPRQLCAGIGTAIALRLDRTGRHYQAARCIRKGA